MASVELRGLTKRYGSHAAVDDVSLTIEHGRLVCLLGPSGCGKTTTLRLIAGFVEPSAGEIRVGERIVSSPARTLPPEQRNMSMIFQSYALWPHMTVGENVAYGLKLRKNDRDTIARKLKSILHHHPPGCIWRTAIRASCRAASSSAWRWRARWWSSPRPCCSTSRCPISTPICARRCASRCAGCTTNTATPRSMSPTTSPRR